MSSKTLHVSNLPSGPMVKKLGRERQAQGHSEGEHGPIGGHPGVPGAENPGRSKAYKTTSLVILILPFPAQGAGHGQGRSQPEPHIIEFAGPHGSERARLPYVMQ